MPRKCLYSKNEIISAAIDLTRKKGFNSVSARTLAVKLCCSSRPIFSHFKTMKELLDEIINEANKVFKSYLTKEIENNRYPKFKAIGMAYIRFASCEKELFKLLFMQERKGTEKNKIREETNAIVNIICNQVNISKENALLFYVEMWTYVHGIATMIVTNYYDWTEEFASKTLTDMYLGLKYKYENGETQ